MVDKKEVSISYLVTAVVLVLIILLISQLYYDYGLEYDANAKIAIKTSRGLIKLRNDQIAEELARVKAELELQKHKSEKIGRHTDHIDEVIKNIKQLIKRNPERKLCDAEINADIVNKAMSDSINPNSSTWSNAYQSIADFEESSYGTDEDKFVYMLQNLDVLINMLRNDTCSDGMLDLEKLHNLLHDLDEGITIKHVTPITNKYITPYDPYFTHKLGPFQTVQSQTEGLSNAPVNEIDDEMIPRDSVKTMLGPYRLRNLSQRSQMYQDNIQILGTKQYNDEDLLQKPTYEQLAL